MQLPFLQSEGNSQLLLLTRVGRGLVKSDQFHGLPKVLRNNFELFTFLLKRLVAG